MSILDGSVSISNFAIVVFVAGYLVDKFFEKKYGLRFNSDLEMIDYILDKGIDKALITTPKFQVLKEKLGFGKKEEEQTPVPPPKTPIRNPLNLGLNDNIHEHNPQCQDCPIIENVVTMEQDIGLVLSEMQLEVDHMKDTMVKGGLDINNGDSDDINHTIDGVLKPDEPKVDFTHVEKED